jgi:hypothetical protein
MRKKLPSVAWLGKIETDSILKESKMFEAQALKD